MKRGYTLVEIMLVVAIIALIAGVGIAAYKNAVQTHTRREEMERLGITEAELAGRELSAAWQDFKRGITSAPHLRPAPASQPPEPEPEKQRVDEFGYPVDKFGRRIRR